MYGQVAASLRATMTELLHMKRVSAYLGGPHGKLDETTTQPEREAAAHKILRYRAVVWNYALQTATAVIPPTARTGWEAPLRLISWLEKEQPTPDALPGGRGVSTLELGTVQDIPLVEIWRRLAVASVAGRERELPVLADSIDNNQARVVLRDVADLVRALVILDVRYSAIPGWQRLGLKSSSPKIDPTKRVLVNSTIAAAQLCSQWVGSLSPEDAASTDRLGYVDRAPLLPMPYPFGIDGAIAALHNTYVRLGLEFPRAEVVTAIVRTQRQLSALTLELAQTAGDDEHARAFKDRAERCAHVLGLLAKDVGGNLGDGRATLSDAEAALFALADAVQIGDTASTEDLQCLHRLFTMIDTRVATRIRQGIHDRRYFVSREFGLSRERIGGLRRAIRKFEPITKHSHPDLIAAVKRLAPDAPDRVVSTQALTARTDFTAFLERRTARGPGSRVPSMTMAPDVASLSGRIPHKVVGAKLEGPSV